MSTPSPSFGPGTYGASFADVYDDWYGTLPGADDAVAFLAGVAARTPGRPVLELGIGTGRLALPLAARGVAVHGVDASPAMVEVLRAKPGAEGLHVVTADMAGADPAGPYGLVFVAVNTFFNLDTDADQRRCLANVAARLVPGGHFVVEAFVPGLDPERPRDHVGISTITPDRLVLTATREDRDAQTLTGQHVELTDGQVRLRPWRIRWVTPDQLDALAAAAGLTLVERYASWSQEAFSVISAQHVSVYRKVDVG